MYSHVRRKQDGQLDTKTNWRILTSDALLSLPHSLVLPDAETHLLAMGATKAQERLNDYIDVVDNFREQTKFDNPKRSVEMLDKFQGMMRDARKSLLLEIA
jgi:hypothetical protein